MPDIAVAEKPGASVAPSARSPLDGLEAISVAGRLRVAAASHADRLLLRGDAGALGAAFSIALPTTACRSASAQGRTALWLGPDEWLLMAAAGTLEAGVAVEGGVVIDVGHRQVGLVLEGAGAAAALAAGCPLDLHASAFPPGMCTRTVFGKTEIVLWRQEPERFHLEVWRSFAGYVHGLLQLTALDIAAES